LTDAATAAPQRDSCSNQSSFADAVKLALVKQLDQSGVNHAAVRHRCESEMSTTFSSCIQSDVGKDKVGKLTAA
jgi:hypothetical protein